MRFFVLIISAGLMALAFNVQAGDVACEAHVLEQVQSLKDEGFSPGVVAQHTLRQTGLGPRHYRAVESAANRAYERHTSRVESLGWALGCPQFES